MSGEPTIKGIFVLSHIEALRRDKGEEGIDQLKKRYAKSLDFKASDNVPTSVESEILSHIIDITSPKQMTPEEKAFEAGRLHLKNFSTTPLWSLLSPNLRGDPKQMLLQCKYIAELVYDGVDFRAEDKSPTTVVITLSGSNYPPEHFQGFLYEFIAASGLVGTVEADIENMSQIFTITWK